MSYIYRLEDLAKRTRINLYYEKFKSYLSDNPEKIKEIQQIKLNQLIKHAWNNIPWYKEQFLIAGFNPKDEKNISDLCKLAPLSRNDIQGNIDRMIWKDYKGKIFNGSSSGTTGIPINYFQDINGFSAGIASGQVLMSLSGWKPGIRDVHIWGNIESVKQWNKVSSRIKQKIYSRKNIASSLFNDPDNLKMIVEKIIKFKPVVIEGYTNSIYELANFFKTQKITIPSVKMVITTAENLENHHIDLIEEVIAPVSDLYGCGEINGVACKPINDDKYYILDTHVFVEAIASNNSELKEILVTDLDNYYMPLIRYKIGDLIDDVFPASASNKLPFGYFTKIYGRTSDFVILPDGKKIFPVNVFGGTLYRKYSAINRHKTIWNGNKFIFIFEIKGDIDIEALKRDVHLSLSDFDVSFEIKITDKLLPSANGKYKYFEKI